MAGQESTREGPLDLIPIVQEVDGLWSVWDAWLHRETGVVYFQMESDEDPDAAAEIEELIESGKLIRLDRDPWDDNRRAERFIGGREIQVSK